MAERAAVPTSPEPEIKPIPPVGKSPFAQYPRPNEPRCPKCGAPMEVAVPQCSACGYAPHSPWERAGAVALLLLSTLCLCPGPCVVSFTVQSEFALYLSAALFLGLYIWGWVWYVRRYR